MSSSHVPGGQGMAGAEPPRQYDPAAHDSHTAAVAPVAGDVSTVPAWHASREKHSRWFGEVEKVPLTQGEHARSLVALPCTLTKEPGLQTVQAKQT
jgi:hypothetical protein